VNVIFGIKLIFGLSETGSIFPAYADLKRISRVKLTRVRP